MANPTLRQRIDAAKQSVTALRDAARRGGMDFRERDPHVMCIHNTLDELAALPDGPEPLSAEEWAMVREGILAYTEDHRIAGTAHEHPWLVLLAKCRDHAEAQR